MCIECMFEQEFKKKIPSAFYTSKTQVHKNYLVSWKSIFLNKNVLSVFVFFNLCLKNVIFFFRCQTNLIFKSLMKCHFV